MVAARAAAEPDRLAVEVDGGESLVYGAWVRRSNALARGLTARGVRTGQRVGLLFDGRHWADFAVAHLGVAKAGAIAVLLAPGARPPELVRALAESEATGLLRPPSLVAPGGPMWVASAAEVEDGHDGGPLDATDEPGDAALAELVYPAAPMARPRAWRRSHGDLARVLGPMVDGTLVHAWAPGSLPGLYAMSLALASPAVSVVAVGAFDPERLCALLVGRRAAACGLTPALAAAVLVRGVTHDRDLASVLHVVLSGRPSPELRTGLVGAFPRAAVVEVDGGGPPTLAAIARKAESGPVAVSQEGMLWHEQFTPGSFNLPCLVRRHEGPLDEGALGWALSEMVRRHQPLRSTFEVVDGEPRQVVRPPHDLDLAMVDLSTLEPRERDAEVSRLLVEATGHPFDLVSGPLFQPRLLRLGPDDHLLVVRLHHTVFDDWSVDVFRRELSALYCAGLAGVPSPLVEPPTAFVDFCRGQRARMAGELGAAQRSWWRRELDGAPLAVQAPIAGSGGVGRPGPGEPIRLDLAPAVAVGLRALSPQLRATPFMIALSAFSVLLARATGQDDLLIATVVANRDRSDLEPLVGCFTKKIPLRLRLDGDPTFAELVLRTRSSLLGSLSHQAVGFEAALQESLGDTAADHGVAPQVAVVFQGETPQQVTLSLPGLASSRYETPSSARRERHFSSGPDDPVDDGRPRRPGGAGQPAPVWGDGIYLGSFLLLSLLDSPDGMALVARGVFDGAAGRRLLEDFHALLADVVADPSRPVSALWAGEVPPVASDDVVELRGFHARRSHLEPALARCPGVAEVAVAVDDDVDAGCRLVAYVVADCKPPPALAQLRRALWDDFPGVLWPAEAVMVDVLPRRRNGRIDIAALPSARPRGSPGSPGGADSSPGAVDLAAMWGEVRGRPAGPGMSYWQDFSFLQVLAEARDAGMVFGDDQVVRCRTPEMLAAAMAVGPPVGA